MHHQDKILNSSLPGCYKKITRMCNFEKKELLIKANYCHPQTNRKR